MTTTPTIRPLTPDDAPACDAVILSLPYFFGDPTGREDCAAAVRSQQGFVAEIDGNVAGFITLLPHFEGSSEITWMAVHADHRRHGIGQLLIGAAVRTRSYAGDRMICVLTLGPSVPEDPGDNYDGTRAFYRAQGFVPLRELGLREWNDSHALILGRAL
jgi:GNAT superfamily N-acetyltransferase